MLKQIIRRAEEIPLTIDELRDIANNGDFHIDIQNATKFAGFNAGPIVILFYPTKSANFGHYTTLIYRAENTAVEHFDSYGLGIQKIYDISTYTKASGPNKVLDYCEANGLRLYESKADLQKNTDLVNTCGRWAGVRARFHRLNNFQFVNLFQSMSVLQRPDDIVSLMTLLSTTRDNEMYNLIK